MDSKTIVVTLKNAAIAALRDNDYRQFIAVCDLLVYLESKHLVHREDAEEIMKNIR